MKHPSRILLILSLTLNVFAVAGSLAIVAKKGGLPWLSRKVAEVLRPQQAGRNYPDTKQSVLEQLPIGPNDTVFLGDSILALGEWHELLSDHRAKNRAISGAGTRAVLSMLDRIIVGKPRHVVLMCGINNFHKRIPYKQTAKEYAQIVARISSQSPRTDIWMLPVLPVNEALYQQWFLPGHPGIGMPDRHAIEALNALIEGLAVNRPRVHFVDLHVLLNNTGELRKDYTSDGLHLNGRGLREIARRLQQLGLPSGKAAQPVGMPAVREGARR